MLQRARADAGAEGMAMRGKRQRGPAGDAADELALPMDPSLMTERQQLAFLLRTTAQEASASESPHSEDEDASGADERGRAPAAARKKARRAREGPARRPARAARSAARSSPRTGRPKPAFEAFPALDAGHRRDAAKPEPHEEDEHEDENDARAGNAKPGDAAKPKSASAVALLKPPPPALCAAAEDAFADARTCALCGQAPSADALFLCPACDRKYPTQQALGRMCMT